MKSADFVVARDDLQRCKTIERQLPDPAALPEESLLVKVTRFAFTANNVTYAVLGDTLKYWSLFPAPGGFGNVPVWGFGEVIASKHPGIAVGETLFGYFPMATHLVIEAADVSKRGLRDGACNDSELALTAGQPRDVAVGEITDAEFLQGLACNGAIFASRTFEDPSVRRASHQHEIKRRVGEKAALRLRHVGDAARDLHAGKVREIIAAERDTPALCRQQSEQRLEQRRLSAAVGAEQAKHRARLDRE